MLAPASMEPRGRVVASLEYCNLGRVATGVLGYVIGRRALSFVTRDP